VDLLEQISEHLRRGDDAAVAELTREAIRQGLETKRILDHGLIAGMTAVGEQFKAHEMFLPDVLLAARAMMAGMEELKTAPRPEVFPRSARSCSALCRAISTISERTWSGSC